MTVYMQTAVHLNAPHALKACANDTSPTLPFTQCEQTLMICLHTKLHSPASSLTTINLLAPEFYI
jgi:hypothetical protein